MGSPFVQGVVRSGDTSEQSSVNRATTPHQTQGPLRRRLLPAGPGAQNGGLTFVTRMLHELCHRNLQDTWQRTGCGVRAILVACAKVADLRDRRRRSASYRFGAHTRRVLGVVNTTGINTYPCPWTQDDRQRHGTAHLLLPPARVRYINKYKHKSRTGH